MYSVGLERSDKFEKEKLVIKKEQRLQYTKIFMMRKMLSRILMDLTLEEGIQQHSIIQQKEYSKQDSKIAKLYEFSKCKKANPFVCLFQRSNSPIFVKSVILLYFHHYFYFQSFLTTNTKSIILSVQNNCFLFPIHNNQLSSKVMQYNKQENQRLLKILIIGNSGVGKSCMLLRYVENNFTTAFYNTIGVDFKMKNVDIDGRKVRMQVWDTAGQDRFRTITSTYYKGAHGIMLVYDVTDRESFDSLRFWLQQIDKYAHENVDKLVVANKSDQNEKRKVSYDEGYEFAKANKLQFTQVSAMNSQNIAEAFQMIARKVLKRLQNSNTPINQSNRLPPQKLKQKDAKKQSQTWCC